MTICKAYVSVAERTIQTFKNHIISGCCATDEHWHLQLWDQLITQAVTTLNLLRISRSDPTKSAYYQLYGHKYFWNKCLIASHQDHMLWFMSAQTEVPHEDQEELMHDTIA